MCYSSSQETGEDVPEEAAPNLSWEGGRGEGGNSRQPQRHEEVLRGEAGAQNPWNRGDQKRWRSQEREGQVRGGAGCVLAYVLNQETPRLYCVHVGN